MDALRDDALNEGEQVGVAGKLDQEVRLFGVGELCVPGLVVVVAQGGGAGDALEEVGVAEDGVAVVESAEGALDGIGRTRECGCSRRASLKQCKGGFFNRTRITHLRAVEGSAFLPTVEQTLHRKTSQSL